jgi:hypothetical protein
MKKLILLSLTLFTTLFGVKIINILSDIRKDVKKIRIIKVGV